MVNAPTSRIVSAQKSTPMKFNESSPRPVICFILRVSVTDKQYGIDVARLSILQWMFVNLPFVIFDTEHLNKLFDKALINWDIFCWLVIFHAFFLPNKSKTCKAPMNTQKSIAAIQRIKNTSMVEFTMDISRPTRTGIQAFLIYWIVSCLNFEAVPGPTIS